MTMKTITLASALVFGAFTTAAMAECTAEAVQEKTTVLNEGMQTLVAENPEKAQEISTELQERVLAAQAADDKEAVCTAFDELIAEMQEG